MSNEQSDRQLQVLVVGLVGGLTCLYLFFTSFWPTALAAWQTWKEKKQVLERIKASTSTIEPSEEVHVQAKRADAEVLLVEPNFALQGAVTRASRQPAAEPTPTEAPSLIQPNVALGTAITPPGELQRSVRPPTSSASSVPSARPAASTSTRTSSTGTSTAKRPTRPPAYQGPLTASRPLWMPPVPVDHTAVLRAEQDAAYAESVVRDLELAQEKEQRKRVWRARRESVKESLLPEPQVPLPSPLPSVFAHGTADIPYRKAAYRLSSSYTSQMWQHCPQSPRDASIPINRPLNC